MAGPPPRARSLLLERAELVVGIGDKFLAGKPEAFAASLTGPPIVVLLTLMRACDRVWGINVVAPAAGAVTGWFPGGSWSRR
jgi:hypothetical protein